MKAKRNTLYIIARTDMDTMTPGRIAAQVSHAANDFQFHSPVDYKEWCDHNNSVHTFGTAIVLEAKTEKEFEHLKDYCNWITDPTYPVRDGDLVHYVEVDTCAWIYVSEGQKVPKPIKKLPLL